MVRPLTLHKPVNPQLALLHQLGAAASGAEHCLTERKVSPLIHGVVRFWLRLIWLATPGLSEDWVRIPYDSPSNAKGAYGEHGHSVIERNSNASNDSHASGPFADVS